MRTVSLTLVVSFFLLAGCAAGPKKVVLPSGENRKPVNNQSEIAEVMSRYYRSQKEAKSKTEAPKAIATLQINKVLTQYIPADFIVYSDASVDLESTIEYETNRPWPEAFGDALAEVDIDMTADLGKRVMTLKTGRLTVAQVLAKYVPSDYAVYAGEAVNMGALVTFDRSITWSEALGQSLNAAGINSTTNFRKKLVLLESKTANPAANLQPSQSIANPAVKPSRP